MPFSQKFNILLKKPSFDLSILLSSIPIYLMYVLLWENPVSTHRVSSLQERTLHIICFAKFNDHTTQLFQDMKIKKKNVDLVTE